MKKRKTAVFLTLILGVSSIIDSIPSGGASICQASSISESSIHCSLNDVTQLYRGVAFSEDSTDLFETATLILQTDNKDFDTQSADKVLSISNNLYAISFSDSRHAKAAYLKYKQMTGIDFVEPDAIVSTDTEKEQSTEKVTETSTSAENSAATEHKMVQSAKKSPLKVAVIDTGVDINNSTIAAYLTSTENVTDQNGHGTEIAGLLADSLSKDGLAPGQVEILPIKVADANGKCSMLQLYLGMEAALDAGADILNISMGTKNTAGSNLLWHAVDDAYEKGVIVVTSAGNNQDDVSLYTPANMDKAITVGSANRKKERSNFSNYGKTLDCVSYGENINVTGLGGKKETVNGTSFSAVLVTADLLTRMIVGDILTPDDADAYIKSNAVDLGTIGWDEEYGYGLIGSYTYPADEPETEKETGTETQTETETQSSSEVTTVDDTTQPVTNYADSGDLTEAQQNEMQACLAYGDILNDINTVAATQNVYAATGLISLAKTKAAQLQSSIQTGYITARYFTGQGYVCPVTYQNIGNQPVDTAGKTMEDSLYTYGKSGSSEDLTAFYGKLDEFYNALNANRNLNVQAESTELTNLTSAAAASAADQLNAQATLDTADAAVSIEAYEVGFLDTEAINQWQNLESNKLLESLNGYNAAQLKKFVTSLSDNDQQLLAARLGQYYQDIMARVYDAEVQTESADQTTYYVADEASNRLYAQVGSSGSDTVTVNSTMTLQPVTSILLTSPVTVNNYMVVSKGTDVAIDSTNAANGYNLGSNFDYTKTAGSDTSTFDGKTYYPNYTFSMIYIQSGATLSIQGKAFLDGKNRPHNGFLIFMQDHSTLKLKNSAVLRNNKMVTYSGQKNGGYGSAVCVSNGSTLNMTGGSILNNMNCDRDIGKLTQGGAAIGNKGGTVNISNGIISGNTSALGAIWNCAGTLNITGGTITGNSSDTGMGGNIHLSKDGAQPSIANISGGTICDSVVGNGIFVSNGCTCNITDKDVYIYGNKEAGISNGGTLNITAGVKIGFGGYTDLSSYSVNQNGTCGILNDPSGTLNISGAARIYGGSVTSLINYGNCTVNAGSDAIFLGVNAECVCNNMGFLNVAGHDANGRMSLGIYSSSSTYGISNTGIAGKGQLIFGGNIDGSYNVTTTGRQASSPTQHSFQYCLSSNSAKHINETSYPFTVYISGSAIIHNGDTGIKLYTGSAYMDSGDLRNNTKDGVCIDSGATATIVSNQMNINSNGRNGITNKGNLIVSGSDTNISSNGSTGISNSGTAILYSGILTANNRGILNSGNLTISGGSITSNSSDSTGAGIYNKATGSLTLSGGSIQGNHAGASGAGIYNFGSVNMTGGSISGNSAGTYGGGVMNKAGAVFSLNGGSIVNNVAGTGGGIFNSGTVNMTAGNISSNTNHGIYQSGTFNMSGAAVINTNNDVCLTYGKVITVNGALTTAGAVANITPLNRAGSVFTKITGDDNYQTGGLGVSVVQISYNNGKASSALFCNSSSPRFLLSNGGILRPGDYMDDEVVAAEKNNGTTRNTITDTDIAISTPYSITYEKNLDNVNVTIPMNQSKYWCEDVKLAMADPVITDAVKAAQFEFLHWNSQADDKGATYVNGQYYKGNNNITIYAQWQNNINIAYIGNEQEKGDDYTDQNVSQSKDYTFGSNQDVSGEKHFDKTAIKTYTDAETGSEVKQEVSCTVVGWKLGNSSQSYIYGLKEIRKGTDIFHSAESTMGALTYGTPTSDYGSHDSLASQLSGIHSDYRSTLSGALFSSSVSEQKVSSIFGASPLDGTKGTPYINLYAVWDEGPSIEAYDLYYDLAFAQSTTDTTGITMEELLSQAKAIDTEDGTLAHGKDVPIGNGKVTSYVVKDYAPTDFSRFATNGTVSVCYQATDSVGNVTEKTILVHIVDTTARDINAGSVRFIEGKYLNKSEENGGFADNSIWIADQQYHDLLAFVLGNSKTNIQTAENSFFGQTISIQKPGSGTWKTPPQETWAFTHEQVLAVHDYVDQNGIGNSKNNTALSGFSDHFAECKQ